MSNRARRANCRRALRGDCGGGFWACFSVASRVSTRSVSHRVVSVAGSSPVAPTRNSYCLRLVFSCTCPHRLGSARNAPFVFRLNQAEESNPQRAGGGCVHVPQSWCRGGAVSGVECRPMCRDMPLLAAICRSLERKSLIFLGVGFSSQAEGRGTHQRLDINSACRSPSTRFHYVDG